ncbi:MAG: hypothetical protein IJ494_03280 [Bacteroides sp.]|nr:hypothetical protein [Bacteroides sp.]
MKNLFLISILLIVSHIVVAQNSVTDYLGTWKGESGDTIFTITLIQGDTLYNNTLINVLGGYSIAVKGEIIDDYLNINTHRIPNRNLVGQNIYIDAAYHLPAEQYLGFMFYDQRKKHFNGEGILGGVMKLITFNQLHWTLDEKYGIWHKIEGDEDAEEVQPIGFSVPTDIILTKVE